MACVVMVVRRRNSVASSVVYPMIIPIPEDRAEWLALRQKHIGGSEVSALFGEEAGYAASAFTLYQVKSGRIPDQFSENDRTDWGLRLEPAVAKWAAETHGWTVLRGGYAIDDTTPGLGATLDYQIVHHNEEQFTGPGALQIKCVDYLVWKRVWGGSPPLYVELQHHHEMAAAGFSWGAVACLVGGNDPHLWKRKARPRLTAEIRSRVRQFWQDVLDGVNVPTVDGSDSTAAALRAMFPKPQDSNPVEIPEDLQPHVHEFATILINERAASIASNNRQQAAKNFILAVMGDADSAYVPPPDFDSPALYLSRDKRGTLRIKEAKGT